MLYDQPTMMSSKINVPKYTSRTKEHWKTTSNSSTSSNENWKTCKSKKEGWKMSTKPHHAQPHQNDDLPSTSTTMLNPSWQMKPLPQEPLRPYEHYSIAPNISVGEEYYMAPGPFHLNTTPLQQPHTISQTNNYSSYNMDSPYTQAMPFEGNNGYQPSIDYNYNQYPVYNEQPTYSSAPPLPPPLLPSHATSQQKYPSQQSNTISGSPSKPVTKKEKKKIEKKVRQITVQSINAEHRAWIDILPSETGLSLAEKIHVIATFRTRKIVSITTASGRKIPLDNRPVFGSWMEMDNFVDGEQWSVEWCENDRGAIDKFISKIVQVSGGKRSKDHVA
ncbi:uncharacterized protein BX663DRAFT_514068 [Cokeromyces recurvatus]|uniref:uncharacterized protein n=1 Tax=Cokeromyces recurvatus TaxID=90255 RepID=UPI00221E513F|nr:uncharacterized protein BX663DRAFT_514068 [Cokeromyces recurvatus]KAI7901308.1 hypothetical protein BX663DRAFT_514068 [Cokeromyces recurvatus]